MTDFATTVSKKKHVPLKIRPDQCYIYSGSEGNNNHHVILYVNKDGTQPANNDTITITLG